MYPLTNEYTALVDDEMIECQEGFKPYYVDQLLQAKDKLCNDMCKSTSQQDFDDLQYVNLNKKTITKDKLCVWLESAICLLNSFCAPVLSEAQSDIVKLKEEKVSDQKKIIQLQDKLIEKKDEELEAVKSSVQSTVKDSIQSTVQTALQSEIKTFSSVVEGTCSKALAPKRMEAVMRSASEYENWSRNLIIYGLKEDITENLEEKVLGVLEHLGEKPRVMNCCRIGRKDSAANGPKVIKPVKFTLAGADHVRQILTKTKWLKQVEGFEAVYVCPDRSVESRQAYRKLVVELKKKRANETSREHTIKNNMIISTEKG